jgi:hypothetical protein
MFLSQLVILLSYLVLFFSQLVLFIFISNKYYTELYFYKTIIVYIIMIYSMD